MEKLNDKALTIVAGLATIGGFVLTLVSGKIAEIKNDRKITQAAEEAVQKLIEQK